jgi:hypothetical protein
LVLALIGLNGCTDKFKVGDCYSGKGDDVYSYVFKIIAVGQFSVESITRDGSHWVSRPIDGLQRTDCFNFFDGVKNKTCGG